MLGTEGNYPQGADEETEANQTMGKIKAKSCLYFININKTNKPSAEVNKKKKKTQISNYQE